MTVFLQAVNDHEQSLMFVFCSLKSEVLKKILGKNVDKLFASGCK